MFRVDMQRQIWCRAVSPCFLLMLAVVLLLSIGAGVRLAKAEPRSVILACNDFPPLKIEHPGADGLRGTDVEAIAEIGRRAGVNLKARFMPWNRGYAEASDGRIDGLCSCSYREDRASLFHFSDAIGETSIGVFTRATGSFPEVSELSDLKSRRIGVVKGYNLENELIDAGLPYKTVSSDRQAHDMLINYRFDYLYAFQAPVDFMLRASGVRDITYTEMRSSPYFICLSKAVLDTADMLPRVNAAIAEMRADGTFADIQRRYGQANIN